MKIVSKPLVLTFVLLAAGPAVAATSEVNCNQGDTLTEALAFASAGDTLTVSGVCEEAVTVTVNGVTLNGGGNASIVGGPKDALTINGAQGVAVRGFKIRDSLHGLVLAAGASIMLEEAVVRDNVVMGIAVAGNSSLSIRNTVVRDTGVTGIDVGGGSDVAVTGKLAVRDNSVFGINLAASSSITFSEADVDIHNNTLGIQISIGSSAFIADADTTVNTSNNLSTGFTVNSGSTLFLFEGAIVSNNNQFNHGVSVSSNSQIDLDRGASITVRNNGIDGIRLEDASVNMFTMAGLDGPSLIASGNARHGVSLFLASAIDLAFTAAITSRNNGDAGLLADNGSVVRVINSRFTNNDRDVVLSFGTRADLSNNTIGAVECDATVLVRGNDGIICPVQ